MMANVPLVQGSALAGPQGVGACDPPPFDAEEFAALNEMIGSDGVAEIVEIFEVETRARLRRLTAGGQDVATLVREMHTLKGAANTVASPRLAEFGRRFEQAARRGIVPTSDEFRQMESALEAWLAAVRDRIQHFAVTR